MPQLGLTMDDFTVAWITALHIERAAAEEMLDEEYDDVAAVFGSPNSYTFGRIGMHNVAIASLPAGRTGTCSAAIVASEMKTTFPSLLFGLLVGVGGGVPSANDDVRLGDVVISQPSKDFGGVVQYDMGKTVGEGVFTRTGSLNAPPRVLLDALSKFQANLHRGRSHIQKNLNPLVRSTVSTTPESSSQASFPRPEPSSDILFKPGYDHTTDGDCEACDKAEAVQRAVRATTDVKLHFGTIASGNQVIKHGATRDKHSAELGGIMCFEMEAAGLMNDFPCIVIRGICDYADSHKKKAWQPYAAAAAAATAKDILRLISTADVSKKRKTGSVSKKTKKRKSRRSSSRDDDDSRITMTNYGKIKNQAGSQNIHTMNF